jgi:putative Mg2+ transporter-C (MgtC) family protein
VYLYPPLLLLLPGGNRRVTDLRVRYADGQGVLRRVLATVTSSGFAVTHVDAGKSADGQVAVEISVLGEADLNALAARVSDVDGVVAISTGDEDESEDLTA